MCRMFYSHMHSIPIRTVPMTCQYVPHVLQPYAFHSHPYSTDDLPVCAACSTANYLIGVSQQSCYSTSSISSTPSFNNECLSPRRFSGGFLFKSVLGCRYDGFMPVFKTQDGLGPGGQLNVFKVITRCEFLCYKN